MTADATHIVDSGGTDTTYLNHSKGLLSWIVTLPVGALLSIVFFFLFRAILG